MTKKCRFLSVLLTLVMVASLFAGFTVNAASPIVLDGVQTEVFNQNFGGIGSAAGAPDFDISNPTAWTYSNYYLYRTSSRDSVVTKNDIDLTDSEGFEFQVAAAVNYNDLNILLPNGYRVFWSTNSKTYDNLAVSGSKIPVLLKDDVALAAGPSTGIQGKDILWTIKYLAGKWYVSIDSKKEHIDVFTDVVDSSNPKFNGKFGIQAGSTPMYLFRMKLTKLSSATVVNHWKFDADFKATDTAETYVDKGLTFPASAVFYDGRVSSSSNTEFKPNGKNISGSYTFTTKIHKQYNRIKINFNKVDNKNYYQLRYYHQGSRGTDMGIDESYFASDAEALLTKVVDGKYIPLAIVEFPSAKNCIYTTTISVINENGENKIDVTLVSGSESKSLSYIDSDTDKVKLGTTNATTGEVTYADVDTGAPFATGYIQLDTSNSGSNGIYEFSARSIVTDADKNNGENNTSDWYSGDEPLYVARFYGESGAVTGVVNGPIYFEYPTFILGDYKVVATLHENNEMTGIKLIDPFTLYAGKVKLFNVTDAANAKVRVYFFDAEDTLNRITDVYELN